jgi:cell division protein FtsI/penicillin-binding protein 2
VDLRHLMVSQDGATAPLSDGRRARLTLEPELQQAALKLLKLADPVRGAVVVVHAPTGKVLVWAEHQRGSEHPAGLLYQASAPAASVFKIVTTAALLERAKLGPATKVCIAGGTHGIERRHLEAARSRHRQCSPFWLALGHSRNAVFAQLATRYLMRDDLLDYADRFGFGHAVAFEAEVPMGSLAVPYNDLEFARSAAGFRGSTLSPLGALSLAYTVAAGGEAVRLHVLEDAGESAAEPGREVVGRVIEKRTADELTRMMEITVRSGTSREVFHDDTGRPYLCQIRVAGKTGTLKPTSGSTTSSWFTGFAPSRNPEIVLSVLVQNGPVWRRKANEVARDLLRIYFAERGLCRSGDPLAEAAPPREPRRGGGNDD